jgi:hypothetical protein
MALLDIFASNKFKQLDDLIKEFQFGQQTQSDRVEMFNFNTQPFGIANGNLPEFNALMKNPTAEAIPQSKPIEMQNYKVKTMEPIKIEKAFGDIVTSKEVEPVSHKNPDYYQYKLNKYDLTDLAMKTLDTEQGELNDINSIFAVSKSQFEEMKAKIDKEFSDATDLNEELALYSKYPHYQESKTKGLYATNETQQLERVKDFLESYDPADGHIALRGKDLIPFNNILSDYNLPKLPEGVLLNNAMNKVIRNIFRPLHKATNKKKLKSADTIKKLMKKFLQSKTGEKLKKDEDKDDDEQQDPFAQHVMGGGGPSTPFVGSAQQGESKGESKSTAPQTPPSKTQKSEPQTPPNKKKTKGSKGGSKIQQQINSLGLPSPPASDGLIDRLEIELKEVEKIKAKMDSANTDKVFQVLSEEEQKKLNNNTTKKQKWTSASTLTVLNSHIDHLKSKINENKLNLQIQNLGPGPETTKKLNKHGIKS